MTKLKKRNIITRVRRNLSANKIKQLRRNKEQINKQLETAHLLSLSFLKRRTELAKKIKSTASPIKKNIEQKINTIRQKSKKLK